MMNAMKNIRWGQVILAFCLGAFLTASVIRWRSGPTVPLKGERGYVARLEQFSSKLDLTPEQREKVAAIFDSKRQRIAAIRQEMKPKFDEIWQTTRGEIRQTLGPEQQLKFDELYAGMEKQREKFRKKRKQQQPSEKFQH